MKVDPSSPLLTYLAAGGLQFLMADLYTIELIDGSVFRYTDIDKRIVYDGDIYSRTELQIEGLRYKVAVGLEVDEQDIRISALTDETIGTATFFTAVGAGLLDGAYITRQRAFWQPNTGIPSEDYNDTPLAVVTLFIGRVATITKLGRTHVEIKVKSPLSLLDIDMPRNTYQPGCQWLLYDQGCALNRALFTTSYVVVSADEVTINVASIATPTGADGNPYYMQGRIVFTSGTNDGLTTLAASNGSTFFTLQYPLITPPSPGDTFDASAGCVKTVAACEDKFNNRLNFRGFLRVPPIVVSV